MEKLFKVILLLIFCVLLLSQRGYADNFKNGLTALKGNNLGAALQFLSKSVQENRSDPVRLYYLAVTLKNMGEKARAKRAYEAALKMKPSSDLKKKINYDLNKLSYSKPTVSLNTSSKVQRIQKTVKRPNYLEYVTRNQKIYHWDTSKMPLKVYIASGKNIPSFNPLYKDKILLAMRKWQSALNRKVTFTIVNSPDKADIKIGWLTKFAGHRIGENPFVSLKDIIVRSDINLSTQMPDGRAKTPDELYAVALHEMGHVLGIQGHSPYKDDVMYYSLNENNYNGVLTERDINTIKMLYSLEADVSNKLPLSMADSKEFYKLQLQAEKYILLKNYKTALDYYIKAYNIYQKDFMNNYNIGICYLNLNDNLSAMKHLELAAKLNPSNTFTKYNLAVAQINYLNTLPLTERPGAMDYYRKALVNLQSIANKPDKPPNTDKYIEDIKAVLAQLN